MAADLSTGAKKPKFLHNGNAKVGGLEINVYINGKPYKVNTSEIPPETSLNAFIRDRARLPGTKFMCLEGGCGACIVTATGKHPVSKKQRSWAINSCLTPVYACDGLQITTIEGIGNKKIGYHPVQKRLAGFHGTQCGYCSPGMAMNMYSLLQAKHGNVTMEEVENSFGGNICRCTGYRPILDAFKSMATDADPKYKKLCNDIEDLPKVCPKSGASCNGSCNGSTSNMQLIFENGQEWHKVQNLVELFNVLEEIGTKSYMIVGGNTAHGVYRRDDNIKVFIDIKDIPELHSHSVTDSQIRLGGNVNLTDTMTIFKSAAKKNGFEYCKQLQKHIDLIANVPVRNAGTIAGNFSIKHAHPEFPSDLLLILEAVGAEVTIAKQNNSSTTMPIRDYLKDDMNKKVILSISLKPLDPKRFSFKSYKIMPRAQNAHAYVNAAFLYEIVEGKMQSCSICIGGINPEILHASKTEAYLIEKDLHSEQTLKECINILQKELVADWVPPDASPEYRENLALSLFYKSVLATCPESKLKPEFKSGGNILERPVSTAIQKFDTYRDKWPMTQPIPKVEGLVQCSGEAQYVNDIPHQPGELWAAYVHATEVHAKIISIDAADALALKGVEYFFSAKDIPGDNNFTPRNLMMISENEEIFCGGIVKFHGQPAGIVLAETMDLALKASKLVKIKYEKTGKTILPTIKDIYHKNATERIYPTASKLVPTTEGKSIVKSFKGRFQMSGQYHFSIETQVAVCIPIEDGLELYSSTQWVDFVQVAVARCLKISENSINMQVRRLGGGYGGKITRCSQTACACAIGSKLSNRPVRFILSIESAMETIGKRHGLISDYEVSIDNHGKIQKLINNFTQDMGSSKNEEPIGHSLEFSKNCYNFDTWKVEAKLVLTDAPSHTWCRAPGTTEGIAMIENIMEHIARETGQDPIDVRMSNIPDNNKMKQLLPEFIESVEYRKRKSEINDFNTKNRWRKRGIAVVPMQYALGFFGTIPVMVSIFHSDGTVAITHGGIECGQGINTKVVQVAARTLGVPLEFIKIKPSLNYVTVNSGVTGGSMTSEAVCYGAMKACETLLERMKPVRDKMPYAKWHEITEACYAQMIELSTTHMYNMREMKNYTIWGLSCAEIEVDVLTGNFQLRRVDIMEDTGESISPHIDLGQVEGAFIMGLGYWLMESLVYKSETGELLTNRSWNYKPPGAKDIPIDFRVTFLRNSSNELNVLRSKATGEPAFCMSVVAIFALRHAIESARKDNKLNGWINLGAPTTAEEVFLNCAVKPESFSI